VELKKAVPISSIKLGRRIRKDFGDIEGLWQSIQTIGLLQPIVVDRDMTLKFGARRLKAHTEHGVDVIDVLVCNTLDDQLKALIAERDENTCREPFKPSEMVRMVADMDEAEREAAKNRQRKHGGTAPGKPKNTSEKFTQVSSGKARDKIANAVGSISGVTYERAKTVVKAAEEDPETYGDLVEKMDTTGKVNPAYNDYRARKNGGEKPSRKNNDGQRKAGLSLPPGKAEKLRAQLRELRKLLSVSQIQLSPIHMRACMDEIEAIVF